MSDDSDYSAHSAHSAQSEYSDRPGERPSYRISDDDGDQAKERKRLSLLGDLADRRSAEQIERLGIRAGWRCLDVGSGAGSLARWMAERVGPTGSVLSTDVDVRFQAEGAVNLEVRRHDVVKEELPVDAFDLVHARAVLQTIEQREAVLDKLVRAARPGGWLLVGDPEWAAFDLQPLPAPFRALHDAMLAMGGRSHGYDRHWASRLPSAFQARGLTDIDCVGTANAMHGGTDSAEWLILAYERASPALVQAGILTAEAVQAGLQAARDPGFLALGPLSVACWGRKPEAR